MIRRNVTKVPVEDRVTVHHAIVDHVIVHPMIVHHVIGHREIALHDHREITRYEIAHQKNVPQISMIVIAIYLVIVLGLDRRCEEVFLIVLIITHPQFQVIPEELLKKLKDGDQIIQVMITWTRTERHLVVDILVLNGILVEIILGVHNIVH